MAADAEGLFAAHNDQLIRYLSRATGHADAARDLAQDVFVRISRAEVPAVPGHEVRAWLFAIARNLVIDYHRHRQRTPMTVSLDDSGRRPPSQDVAAAVNEALGALTDLDRDVFLMREVAGLSYDEIARACELTADAVRSRIHRTRLRLRQDLAAPIATHRVSTLTLRDRRT
jgi:RNA polymerase sigma-70 factor (ECF subfamily)